MPPKRIQNKPPKAISKPKPGNVQQKSKPKPKLPPAVAHLENERKNRAAIKIQKDFRRYLAICKLEKMKLEKKTYDETMERLEKEAFVQMVKIEREKFQKEQEKEDEARRRKMADLKRRKRFLEAAFDGDDDELRKILKEVSRLDDEAGLAATGFHSLLRKKNLLSMVNTADANGNSALSEACAGGNLSTVQFLIDEGAVVNSQGQFDRTPLYRAAFAGHFEVIKYLLAKGADPRIYSSDGMRPVNVAATKEAIEFLEEWSEEETDVILLQIEEAQNREKDESNALHQNEENRLEDIVAGIQKEYNVMEKQLEKAHCELNKRIYEHDRGVAKDKGKDEITIQAINDAECHLDDIQQATEKVRQRLQEAKLKVRELRVQKTDEKPEDLPGLRISIREIDDVLLRDVGNKMKDSGKWTLLIDIGGQALTFLRYRDTNYVNALSPVHMAPDALRLSLLGALRFGKPLVIDLMDLDSWNVLAQRFDAIQPQLSEHILSQEILKEHCFKHLIRESDGPSYEVSEFNPTRLGNFKLFVVTKQWIPGDELIDLFYVIRVVIPGADAFASID